MRTALSSLAVVMVIAGCGYKGPLYLPKPKPEAQKPAASVTPATSVEPVTPVSPGAPGMPTTPATPPLSSTPSAPASNDPTKP